jgi:hypothetical protein
MKKYLFTGTCLLLISLFLNGYLTKSDAQGKSGPLNKVCSGVNIHFTKGHEKDLDMIAAAGFKFIRMDLVWEETDFDGWTCFTKVLGCHHRIKVNLGLHPEEKRLSNCRYFAD